MIYDGANNDIEFKKLAAFLEKISLYTANKVATIGENDNNYNQLINVGVCNINRNANGPRREIYIMVDLIEGEVTNKNYRQILCPYMGEYLGNELDYLIRNFQMNSAGIDNKWDVTLNRMMFSLKKLSMNEIKNPEKKGATQELVGTKLEASSGSSGEKLNIPSNDKPNNESINNYFLQEIVENDDDDIKNALENLNKYLQDGIDNTTLLKYLNKNSSFSNLISNFAKVRSDLNPDILSKVDALIGEFKGKIEAVEKKLKRMEDNSIQNTDINEKNKAEFEKFNNLLYLTILNKMEKLEKARLGYSKEQNKTRGKTGGYRNKTRKLNKRKFKYRKN
jgi:hypothetical protein